jgi:anhydro-N-acetylmuramic acid kinase
MELKNKYKVIGLMSGTSLDGLDIAYCVFKKNKDGWSYEIEKATTLKYPAAWIDKLSTAHELWGEALIALNAEFGKYLGKVTSEFSEKNNLKADFIASHGHTIYHQPNKKFTYQLGEGNALHAASKRPVVFDFRSLDVALEGEGAPLVPAGDKFLFGDYDVCLNLGGIANLSRDVKKDRVAYDICFCNMGLNYLMSKINKSYDKDGNMSSEGEINIPLQKSLDKIYRGLQKKRPSLGRELFETQIKPLLDNEKISLQDRLHTITESVAIEISKAIIEQGKNPKVLCTGGGAFNAYLISRILDHCGDNATLIIPEDQVVKFKEALVFAFLGVLRVRGEVNCLKSVTGAIRNSSSGCVIGF